MKRRIILFIVMTAIAVIPALSAENAAELLDRTAQKVRTSKSVKATYRLNLSGSGTASGTLTLAGDKFVMASPDMTVWYDGTTQWVYLKADNEVNITEPTADELRQVNPFVIINSFRQAYSAKMVSDTQAAKKISLTANSDKSDIRSASITINSTTMMPTEIAIKMASGQSATITITSLSVGGQLPVDTFRFPAAAYPGAEIIDLR